MQTPLPDSKSKIPSTCTPDTRKLEYSRSLDLGSQLTGLPFRLSP